MIRRELRPPDGEPGWALISQQEHARLSAGLLRLVVRLPGAPDDQQQLADAVARHDDGWAEFDARPELDDQGRPRSFTEMELEISLAIWSESIDVAIEIGPLAAWLVAGHFSALLAGGQSQHGKPAAVAWLKIVAAQQADWLAAWNGPRQVADECLRLLQTLDAASLWICCNCPAWGEAARIPPEPFQSATLDLHCPDPGRIATAGAAAAPAKFQLSARGVTVPAAAYSTPESLLAAATPHEWRWEVGMMGQ
ncbi:DUF3891 family protein [Pirellulales bacterium]|nr:DUF3891 family protein [Pirellulales bacterium]